MKNILVIGAGKIGSLITSLLLESGKYQVTLVDLNFSSSDAARIKKKYSYINMITLDVTDEAAFEKVLSSEQFHAMVSSLPYFVNTPVAKMAKKFEVTYFDLTEDVKETHAIKELSEGASSAFVPQCGLAPGMIGIIAHEMMKGYDDVEMVKMRVGALPFHANNALHYALTWSTDGLINEYGNPCVAIEGGKKIVTRPLEGLERIQIDGLEYEAFNTSGGLGSLPEVYQGKLRRMNYKTMRYPGHCKKMRFLMQDLKLNDDRETLKRILENAIPKTHQDIVIIYVNVIGMKNGEYLEETYVKKIYPLDIAGLRWAAIQVSTAAGLCCVLDFILANSKKYKGFVHQEDLPLSDLLDNSFGKYYL